MFKRRVRILETGRKNMFGRTSGLMTTYQNYCNSKKIKKHEKLNNKEVDRVSRAILKEISHQMQERSGGVLIHKFGYFSVFYAYGFYSKPITKNYKVDTLDHSGLRVRPLFIPHALDTNFKLWTLDFSFFPSLYNNVKKNIVAGKVYKSYFYTLRKLLGRSSESHWHFTKKTKENELEQR